MEPLIPRPFQRVAIERGISQNLLIADEPGLGKTLDGVEIARGVCTEYGRPGQVPLILVLARVTLHGQWVETIRRQDTTGVEDDVFVVDRNTRLIPKASWGAKRRWIVTSYDTLIRLPGFANINWMCIVADEVHKIRNRKNKRTEAIHKLRAVRCIGLTGTEKDKHPGELWSYLHWFDRESYRYYGNWERKFVETETIYMRETTRQQPVGTKKGMEEELRRVMSQWMIKRSKAEVAPDLPPLIEQDVNHTLTAGQRALYDRIVDAKDAVIPVEDLGMDGEMGMGVMLVDNAMVRFIRLQQVAADPLLLNSPAPSSKLLGLEEWLEEDSLDEPFVVFTKFRDTAIRIANRSESDLVIGGVQYGPEGAAARFKRGETRGVVGTIASMSEGLNLQRAKTVLFVDESWSSIEMRQAMDRVHRMDITEPKYVRYLRCPGTVEDDVREALTRKWNDNQLLAHLHAKYGV